MYTRGEPGGPPCAASALSWRRNSWLALGATDALEPERCIATPGWKATEEALRPELSVCGGLAGRRAPAGRGGGPVGACTLNGGWRSVPGEGRGGERNE